MSLVTEWNCDYCGKRILTPDNGLLTWEDDLTVGSNNFKIVHQGTCDDHSNSCSQHLKDCIGDDGLTYLLSLLSCGPIMKSLGRAGSAPKSNNDQLVDVIRRLHIDGYEDARQKFSNPTLLSDFDDSNEVYPYLVRTLKNISKKY
ncbi:hypothetical protein [Bdellovibrio bacteriovorus]|uniref:hypothetical protein n=1 Tax=Bdellovibrio bacteriovorus TaxID=959 RepID=UPI003D01FC8A